MNFKTQIVRGSRVLVKTRTARGTKVCEGKVLDAHRDCLNVQFRWWLFTWSKWIPIQDGRRTIEYLPANSEVSHAAGRKG